MKLEGEYSSVTAKPARPVAYIYGTTGSCVAVKPLVMYMWI